ncbi:MAG: DUF3737 family protein [Bacteroides sp.]|nr:DUF3737 family protein [Bacteroides sp.]MCM1550760.1 DUF3737 family protein [Clostridium sp.]
MKFINQTYDEERALYGTRGAEIMDCSFDGPADGESALKETSDLTVERCYFNLRYPFWHTKQAVIRDTTMTENCRAALWYDEAVRMENCRLNGIKALRECHGTISLTGCEIHSPEFAWRCSDLQLRHCSLESEYPFFECRDMEIDDLTMTGKYSFQYVENAVIRNSNLNTKDAFWHSKNVTVKDCVVCGEYLGWYSENLKLIRCKIIGTQPLCYCKGLILEDCTMEQTDLSFENSEVHAVVSGHIDSVKNPVCGEIHADTIGALILESDRIDPSRTTIICGPSDGKPVNKGTCVCA